MVTLSQSMSYADESLRACVEFGSNSMLWLQRNDHLTRGKVASLVRRNYTVGSALEEALRQHHLEWRSPAQPPLASGAALERKRKLEDDPAPPPVKALDDGRRKIKTDRHQTVSMLKGGATPL